MPSPPKEPPKIRVPLEVYQQVEDFVRRYPGERVFDIREEGAPITGSASWRLVVEPDPNYIPPTRT